MIQCMKQTLQDLLCIVQFMGREMIFTALCTPTLTKSLRSHKKKSGFGHDDFYGAQLYERIGYHEFEGITLFEEERARMLESLGDKHILVLRNHGVAVGEVDIERTFFLLWTVQRAAEIQVTAGALGGEDNPINEEIKAKCASLTQELIKGNGFAIKFYEAMVRKMISERGKPW